MALPINVNDLIHQRKVERTELSIKKTGIQNRSFIPLLPSPMTLTIWAEDISLLV